MENIEQNDNTNNSKYWFDKGKVYYLQEKDYQCISAFQKAMQLALEEAKEGNND